MIRFFNRILVWLVLILPVVSFANEITHYTANQGLSGTDITSICENENYIWIATNDGLCRFDGKTFDVFKKENGKANCLSNNNIETLYFDSKGLLWIGFKTGGVNIYDPKTGQFTHISKLVAHYPQRVISIYEDSDQHIWLGSWEEGLFELIPVTDAEYKYKEQVYLKGYIVSSIIEYPKNKLWVGTYAGLYSFSPEQNKWVNEDPNLVVSQLIKTKDDNFIWCSTWNAGILKIDFDNLDKTKCSSIGEKIEDIYRIFPLSDKQLFIGTWGNGLKLCNRSTNTIEPFDSHFKPTVILSFLKDSYNNFWIGTYGNGLFKFNMTDRGISAFSPINSSGYAAAFTIKSLDDNHLILGTEGEGLYHCDLLHLSLQKKADGILKGKQNNFILTIYKDSNLVIIAHDDEGVYLAPYSKKKSNNLLYRAFKADKRFAKITSIFRSNDNNFWFGSKQNGLMSASYNAKNKQFEQFNFYGLADLGQITGIAQYDDSYLWIASYSGLYLFNTVAGKLDKDKPVKVNDMIYSMVKDEKNKCLWLGTSMGLRKLDYQDNNLLEIPFSGLVPQGTINDLIIDSSNNLWFSVGSRVFCLEDNSHKIKEINLGEYGNQLFLSSTIAKVKEKDCVVFGGEKSLVMIDPELILNQPDSARIIFTELQIDHSKVNVGDKIYGKTVLDQQPEYVNKMAISYRCKWVSLSFTQVGWNNFKNYYQYKIDGFSQNWQLLDLDKPIIFSQLPIGDYHLVVKRFNATVDEAPLWNLDIIVIPPWWRTTWFNILLIIAIILIIASILLFIRNHYKKQEKFRLMEVEKKKKEELLLEKESFFVGLSHDLLTPFSLIIAPAGDLLKADELKPENKEKVQIINKNANYLSDIFKTIFEFRRIETIDVTVDEKKIELISYVKMVKDSFEYIARSKKIHFNFKTDIDALTVFIDVVKFERILFNLLSNAFKFTNENGNIFFSLHYDNKLLLLDVKDTGIGIDSDKLDFIFEKFYQGKPNGQTQGLGLGLYIVHKFVELLHGTIKVSSELNKGTHVQIELPVQPAEPDLPTILPTTEQDENVSILLVEDNEEMRNYLKGHLVKHFSVATAADGSEALDFIQNNLPEIVISDVMMPGIDGLSLCNKIKSTPLYADIFVVLISVKSSPEDELTGYKAGADFYIAKPFDCELFIKQILNIYSTRLQHRKQILKSIFNQPQEKEQSAPKDIFLNKAVEVIEKHIMDEDFKIEELASQMNVSKTVLHRKFKILIGETPNAFIRHVRLHKAVDLLENTDSTIAEIAYLTGFNQSHYFIKCFREEFNVTPKTYREQKKSNET